MIKQTGFYSWKTGRLAKGCRLCVRGEKTVLFITGLCSRHCFYCPISEKKKNKDVIYANEGKISNIHKLINEIKLCSSKGVGITGGDPFIKFERLISFIKSLKRVFGKAFHIHLYTPLNLVSEEKLARLCKAGLDEIRFHPDLKDKHLWKRICLSFSGAKGVEIPVIPGMEKSIKELIGFIKGKIDFLNLNELEYSDTNSQSMASKGFFTKHRMSYAIKGSEELAKRLLCYCDKLKINTHYCTATLKDRVQLRNRLKKRAKGVATKFDKITADGTLIRGILYLNLIPSFGYKEKLLDKKTVKKELTKLKKLKNKLGFPTLLDTNKPRLITAQTNLRKYVQQIKKSGLTPAIVEEYPTVDALEVEIEFL